MMRGDCASQRLLLLAISPTCGAAGKGEEGGGELADVQACGALQGNVCGPTQKLGSLLAISHAYT